MNTSNTTTNRWRSWLRVHPAAEQFPLMDGNDLAALADDIKNNGQREPCAYIRDANGPILVDGISRLDARELLGKKIELNDSAVFEQLPADINVDAYVASANIHRRHLTAEEKRARIAALLKANPNLSSNAIAGMVKASPHTVEGVRQK